MYDIQLLFFFWPVRTSTAIINMTLNVAPDILGHRLGRLHSSTIDKPGKYFAEDSDNNVFLSIGAEIFLLTYDPE
jgi:hypothetical protein